jgi:ABC-type multidrug transport system ATPase subunit
MTAAPFSSFVLCLQQQDDIMHDDLSVKENLTFIAGLRLPAKLRNAARHAVVADVMAVLEIDRIAHAVIGNVETRGISG